MLNKGSSLGGGGGATSLKFIFTASKCNAKTKKKEKEKGCLEWLPQTNLNTRLNTVLIKRSKYVLMVDSDG